MVAYSLIVYALMGVSVALFCICLFKPACYFYSPLAKVALSGGIFGISLLPIKGFSIASLLYGLLDAPSLAAAVLVAVSLLRFFVPNIGLVIGMKGFIAIGMVWVLLLVNALDVWRWAYGSPGYEIWVSTVMIALVFCADRMAGLLLLSALLLWIILPTNLNLYKALFDSIVSLFGFFMQIIPPSRIAYMKFSKGLRY